MTGTVVRDSYLLANVSVRFDIFRVELLGVRGATGSDIEKECGVQAY
jgi:hypothetical protein